MELQNNSVVISPESQRLRESIYVGLKTVLNEDEANIALKSWALYTNGSSSAFNGINSFAREVCDSFNKPEKQRDLIKALNRALITKESIPSHQKSTKPEITLATKTSSKKSEPAINLCTSTGNSSASSEFLTFQYVVLGIINNITMRNDDLKSKVITFLSDVIDNMPLSEIQQAQLLTLISNGNLQPTRTYKLEQLKNFLKYLKSWLGDQLGLNIANDLINEVVTEVGKKQEVKDFSPKNLF